MRNSNRLLILLTVVIAGLFLFGTAYAGNGTGDGDQKGFVDLNGDGFNDNMKDDDGDGIPNCVDEDYVNENKSDGTANKNGNTYAYNFQYKPQPKHMLASRHMIFSERKAQLEGVVPTEPMGNNGTLGDGVHNPGMNELAPQIKPGSGTKNGGE